MDYELKYVIAIFLIVKIAALSPEFSISEKKEKQEQQNNGLMEVPLVAVETPGPSANEPHRGMYFIWRSEDDKLDRMRLYGLKDIAKPKKSKETQSFDICEHKIESLESSLKWRNIQKTLRWLNRVLSFNHTNMELCRRKKTHEQWTNFNMKTRNYEFYQSKTKKLKSFFKRKKPKIERKLLTDVKSSIRSSGEKKIRRKRKYKHKSCSNLSTNDPKKLKSKRKGPRYERKHSSDNNFTYLDAILKPNSVFFDVDKILLNKAKRRDVKTHVYPNSKPSLKSSAVKMEKNCVKLMNSRARQGFERKSINPKEGSSENKEGRGHDADSKLPKQKAKAWPHFIYHRVSSNFLHPEPAGHSRRQSAYVAISVVTSSKPEKTDNNISDNVG